jgi:predicted nuclease of predicted toxin-antitoxin system
MKLWIDAQLSPLLADWLRQHFNLDTSNANLQRILRDSLPQALAYLKSGEALVEISGSTMGPSV